MREWSPTERRFYTFRGRVRKRNDPAAGGNEAFRCAGWLSRPYWRRPEVALLARTGMIGGRYPAVERCGLSQELQHFAMNGTKSATKRTDARFVELTWYTARYTIFR